MFNINFNIKELWEWFIELPRGVRVLLCSLVIIVILFFIDVPKRNIISCISQSNESNNSTSCSHFDSILYKHRRLNSPLSYQTLKATEVISGDFRAKRLIAIKTMLNKVDIALTETGYTAYGKKIIPLLNDDETSKIILDAIVTQGCISIHEEIEPNKENDKCTYTATVSLARDAAKDVDAIISLMNDSICINNAVDKLIFIPLKNNNIVEVSLYQIYQGMIGCPSVERVKKMMLECNTNSCDNIYFEKSKYNLSTISKLILLSVFNKAKEQGSMSIEFHGFTDPTGIKKYEYTGDAYISSKGVLLDGNHENAMKLNFITTNHDLSFARAYSCFNYMRSQTNSANNIKYFYTGEDEVITDEVSDIQKRTVLIVFKK